MMFSPDELAARYDEPYRKVDRIEISAERFERGIERGDDGAWGVGALVVHDGRALLVREGGTWLLPGGRLQSSETPEAGAKREVREEAAVEIEIVDLCAIAEQTFVREGSDRTYEFCFATFLGKPCNPTAGTVDFDGGAIDEVSWLRDAPPNTFDHDLVRRLFETHV